MGRISDAWNIQRAFIVPLVCHAYIFYFAMWGYRPTFADSNVTLAPPTPEME
jgi:fucose permease